MYPVTQQPWNYFQVPFFTTQSGGIFESLYVQIPHTAKIVELLGDFMLPLRAPQLPRFSHCRMHVVLNVGLPSK